jgi:hypothetical protein
MPPSENNVVPVNPTSANLVVNAAPSPGSDKVGIFTTPQSLVTFPVATAAVTTIWKVLGAVQPSWSDKKLVPLIVALVIGLLIYLVTVSQGTDFRQKLVEAGVAIINTFTIAAAALGIGDISQP